MKPTFKGILSTAVFFMLAAQTGFALTEHEKKLPLADKIDSKLLKNMRSEETDVAFADYLQCYNSLKFVSEILDFQTLNLLHIKDGKTYIPEPPKNDEEEVYASEMKPNLDLDIFVVPERIGLERGFLFLTDSNSYFLPFSSMGDPSAFESFSKFGYKNKTFPLTITMEESTNPLEFLFLQEKIFAENFYAKDKKGVPQAEPSGWTTMEYFHFNDSKQKHLIFNPAKKGAVIPTIALEKTKQKETAYLSLYSKIIEAIDTVSNHYKTEKEKTISRTSSPGTRGINEETEFGYQKLLLQIKIKNTDDPTQKAKFSQQLKMMNNPDPKYLAEQYFNKLDACEILITDKKIPDEVRLHLSISLHLERIKIFQHFNH